MEPMPDLRRAVHRVLRRWSQRGQDRQPWDRMLVVTQRKQEQPVPDHDLIVKQIVLEALAQLDEQGKGEEAQVLRLRFMDELTAPEIAARLNLAANIVYKRQSKGLDGLAAVVGQMEQGALQERVDRIVERLPFADHPPLLFGVDEKLAELTARLTDGQPPWIVTVGGIGGIGKTSLADAAVRQIAASPVFADIAWISARQERLTPWGELAEDPHGLPALTFEGLLEAL
ncbi:MAG TPA: sigma-70 family RNA polymerase sigma factor, partial [Anaerolineae bacterium]|nr:sigma-70 family RNA polymerase sigma factor [Anaerolineae bacterium]